MYLSCAYINNDHRGNNDLNDCDLVPAYLTKPTLEYTVSKKKNFRIHNSAHARNPLEICSRKGGYSM